MQCSPQKGAQSSNCLRTVCQVSAVIPLISSHTQERILGLEPASCVLVVVVPPAFLVLRRKSPPAILAQPDLPHAHGFGSPYAFQNRPT